MSRHIIQPQLRQAFIERAVRANWILMKMVAVYAIVVELFNMARVLLMTQARLSTLNNRIYFGFYASLFAAGALFLLADLVWKPRAGLMARYRVSLAAGSLFVLWHVLFAVYDINRSISIGKISAVTTLVAFAALFIMEPVYAVANIALSYAILLGFLATLNDSGAIINYCIVGVLCVIIYFARLRDIVTELEQAHEIVDISRTLEETERKFRLTNEQYELLLQRGRLIAFEWDIAADTAHFTPEWEEIFGQPQRIEQVSSYLSGGTHLQPRQKEELFQCMESARHGLAHQKKDLLLPVKNGEQRWFELQLTVQSDGAGRPALGIGLLLDIMDQKSRILKLQQELLMDNFTRTLNKTALESYAARRLSEMRPDESLTVLILDMDDFKVINDTYGHLCGDSVLVQLADLMNTLAPGRARVGRLGGDEFGAVFNPPDAEAAAIEYAARLIAQVPAIEWEGKPMPAACSIGIASAPGGAAYPALYAAADKALYQAKHMGKGRYCVAPPLAGPADEAAAPADA